MAKTKKEERETGPITLQGGFLDVASRALDQIWPLRSAFDILPMTSFSGVNAALQSSCR